MPADGNGWKLVYKGIERVRFMRAVKNDPVKFPRMRNGYWMRKNEDGKHLNIDGNVLDRKDPDWEWKRHIPYEGP